MCFQPDAEQVVSEAHARGTPQPEAPATDEETGEETGGWDQGISTVEYFVSQAQSTGLGFTLTFSFNLL